MKQMTLNKHHRSDYLLREQKGEKRCSLLKEGPFMHHVGRYLTGRDAGDAPRPSNSTHKEAFMALPVLDFVISSSDTHVKTKHAVLKKLC
jgi:hypothetical protein